MELRVGEFFAARNAKDAERQRKGRLTQRLVSPDDRREESSKTMPYQG